MEQSELLLIISRLNITNYVSIKQFYCAINSGDNAVSF